MLKEIIKKLDRIITLLEEVRGVETKKETDYPDTITLPDNGPGFGGPGCSGWVCPKCGAMVPYNTTHFCKK
jgi:rubrerythrin